MWKTDRRNQSKRPKPSLLISNCCWSERACVQRYCCTTGDRIYTVRFPTLSPRVQAFNNNRYIIVTYDCCRYYSAVISTSSATIWFRDEISHVEESVWSRNKTKTRYSSFKILGDGIYNVFPFAYYIICVHIRFRAKKPKALCWWYSARIK